MLRQIRQIHEKKENFGSRPGPWEIYSIWGVGGAERDRTAGLLVANEALSQLSYSPTSDPLILPAGRVFRKEAAPGEWQAAAGKLTG